jgi:hypothetical protein
LVKALSRGSKMVGWFDDNEEKGEQRAFEANGKFQKWG